WAFTRVIKPIKGYLHRLKIMIHSFLDDFLLLHGTQEGLREVTSVVLSLFEKLGFRVNFKKSLLTPSQTVKYLGVLFHLDSLTLSLPHSKILQISTLCLETLRHSSLPSSIGEPVRSPQFCSGHNSSGTSSSSSAHYMDEFQNFPWNERYSCSTGSFFPGSSPDLAGHRFSQLSCTNDGSYSLASTYDRCLSRGLVRGSSSPQSVGTVASGVWSSFIKLAGTRGHLPFLGGISTTSQGSRCIDNDRQHNSGVVSTSSGIPQIRSPHVSDDYYSGVLPFTLDYTGTQTPAGWFECSGRSGLQIGPNHHGVVLGQGNFRMAFFSGRPFPSGSFCHTREHAASLLCLTFSGSLGYRGQCPLPPLGNLGQTLPFSPVFNNGRGGGSFTTLQWKGDIGSPLVCSIKLVPFTTSQISKPNISSP
ncbi:unnamed protein product, partial [Meganyctiphanes norvegica]